MYNTTNKKTSIWSHSYGGQYATAIAEYIAEQNDRINNGTVSASAKAIELDSVGIINGYIDSEFL